MYDRLVQHNLIFWCFSQKLNRLFGTGDNLDLFLLPNLCWESNTKQSHGAPTYYFTNFSRKLNENEEILGEVGGGTWVTHAPLDLPLHSDEAVRIFTHRINSFLLIKTRKLILQNMDSAFAANEANFFHIFFFLP